MRADAHYVEQLASRRERAERADASRHQAGAAEAGEHASLAEPRDRRSDRVIAQLGEEIASITAASAWLATDASPLARRVNVDLVRAHAWRASWLLRASALIDGRHRVQARPKPIGAIVEHVRQGLTPECRLAGAALHLHATDWNSVVTVDEAALVTGITGAVFATLGIIGQTETAIVRVAVDVSGGELRQVEVSQDEVSVPPTASLRFFDASWPDRPGGWSATLAAQTVRSAAQQLGGSAAFVLGDRRGTTIRLNLARG